MTEQEIYSAAIEKWGVATQVMMAMGEFGELIAALNRRICQGRGTNDEVIDEIADAEIMLAQLRHIFGAGRVDEQRKKKLARLASMVALEDLT